MEQKSIIQEALDALALALTEHGHTWTANERELYESATHILGLGEGVRVSEAGQ